MAKLVYDNTDECLDWCYYVYYDKKADNYYVELKHWDYVDYIPDVRFTSEEACNCYALGYIDGMEGYHA